MAMCNGDATIHWRMVAAAMVLQACDLVRALDRCVGEVMI
jgi:hypothetical protein